MTATIDLPRHRADPLALAKSLWEKATARKVGGQQGNSNAATETNVDNIHDRLEARPAGTSADAGLRRLRKAAESGDEKAADLTGIP